MEICTNENSLPFDVGARGVSCVERLLQSGGAEDCLPVLNALFGEIGYDGLKSNILRQYFVTDIYLKARSFALRLGLTEIDFDARFGGADEIPRVADTREGALAFLGEMLESCVNLRADTYQAGRDTAIEKAKEYINNNYGSEELSLSDAAMAANLSPTYFSSLFRKNTGAGFVDYLSLIRVNKAKELLCCTLMQVSEIAYEVGYKDYRYFGKVFKKYTGQTPREYQKRKNK